MSRSRAGAGQTKRVTKWQALAPIIRYILHNLFFFLQYPFNKLLALFINVLRPLWNICKDTQRIVYFVVGWLSAPPTLPLLKRVGYFETKRWHFGIASLAAYFVCQGFLRKWKEFTNATYREVLRLERLMASARDFDSWSAACAAIEKLTGVDSPNGMIRWKREAKLYDQQLLNDRVQHLRSVRKEDSIPKIIFAVRADMLRNLGNMCNSELHATQLVVPEPIREYNKEVQEVLEYLAEYQGPQFNLQEKLSFFRETRHAFGRTALVLSGGGALGAFHVGVAKTLFYQGLLPRVISGSSVGAIVAAAIASRNNQELEVLFESSANFDLSFFSNASLLDFARHLLLKGTLHDVEVLQGRLKLLIGKHTFQQAFMHSGRVLNVAVCPADTNEPPRILNYLSAPNVLIWSAVSCSSAFPLLYLPQDLLAQNIEGKTDGNGKLRVCELGSSTCRFNADSVAQTSRRWRDGSLEEDLPMSSLSEMFNVNHFLVSQTNPHIVPALNMKKRFNRKLASVVESEWKHRVDQLITICPPLRWLKVFSQPWEGDITMVLPASGLQIHKSIINPTQKTLQQACLEGERTTWEKLSSIRASTAIELTLDACLISLTAEEKAEREERMRRRRKQHEQSLSVPAVAPQLLAASAQNKPLRLRSPSWIQLAAFGVPPVLSDENLDQHFAELPESPAHLTEQGLRNHTEMTGKLGHYCDLFASDSGKPQLLARPGRMVELPKEFGSRGAELKMRRSTSVSALSDNMRAPGLPLLECVEEGGSPPASRSSVLDETQTPPRDEIPPNQSTEDGTSFRSSEASSEAEDGMVGSFQRGGALANSESMVTSLTVPDANYYGRRMPNNLEAFECTDRSVNIWETLVPLAVSSLAGQSLDVIAP